MKHINKKIRLGGAARWVSPDGQAHRSERSMNSYMGSRKYAAWEAANAPAAPKKNKKHHSKGPEIIPPVYLPPQLGEHQYGASHSYAETIDLITDGPIEGIVNQNGLLCDGGSILQGIYLNDTPVAVTDNSSIEGYHDIGSLADPVGTLAVDDSDLVGGFFENLKGIAGLENVGYNAALAQQLISVYQKGGSNRMLFRNDGIGSYKCFHHTDNGTWPVETLYPSDPAGNNPFQAGYSFGRGGQQTIGMYTDDYTDYGGTSVRDAKFMFSLGNSKRYAKLFSRSGHTYKHFYYSPWALTPWSEGKGARYRRKCGLNADLEGIYENLWSQTENPHQRQLAKWVLQQLGTQYPEEALGDAFRHLLESSSLRNCHVILRPDPDQTAGLAGISLMNAGQLMGYSFKYLNSKGENVFEGVAGVTLYDFLCPEIDVDGVLTGKVQGFLLISFQWSYAGAGDNMTWHLRNAKWGRSYGVPTAINDALSSISSISYSRDLNRGNVTPTNVKYNYSNVLAEFRKGTETQLPLKYFNKIFIDHSYKVPLYGPFKTNGKRAQSIAPNRRMLSASYTQTHKLAEGLPIDEGSEDKRGRGRGRYDYANWASDSLPNFEEQAIPHTHIVLNPNVESVFVSLMVGQLHDTLHTQLRSVSKARGGKLNPGATYPSILNVRITTGLIDSNGAKTPHKTRNYRITALIESATLIDIGNPDSVEGAFSYVKSLGEDESLVTPIPLPLINQDTLRANKDANLNQSMVITSDSHISIQRYVEVERLSTETNSVLISKNIDLDKITEIIPINLTYPFSTMVGTKLDSRSFDSIPVRSFDCKLKQVKVPSNYQPLLSNGIDRRYYLTQGEFDDTLKEHKVVYKGDWDGTFNGDLQWTDNPAWILYDLLTSTRYGMGQHIKEENINKWQLYEIGRFCDAVNDEGDFLGVPDGHGGREPRFSCNIVFDAGKKIYDALNTIVGIFRGAIFFNNGEINFADDRPRETIDLFTNDTVKGGLFHYANNRRDQSYNTIEVTYTDRFDSYIPKIEVVEDEEDIRQRGVFKKRMAAIGITSRAMARRAAQHQIFTSIKENQTVAFEAGLETLLCQPGDLVIIEDELKTLKENFGKILEVNIADETIRLNNKFVDADMTGRLTVYAPTGRDTIEEIETVANRNRQRSVGFDITGVTNPWGLHSPVYSGDYNFSRYTDGYAYATGDYTGAYEQYALYTGTGINRGAVDSQGESIENINTLYFSTGFTGWVLATGSGAQALADDGNNASWIADHTGSTLYDFGTGRVAQYVTTKADRRGGVDFSVSGLFSGNNILDSITRGFLPSEVMLAAPSQTTVLNVTGEITLKDYGCVVSGVDKPEFLPLLKLGSACKFEIKEASPFIYKVLGIKETNPNEFLVSATKYETGKWELVENNISIEHKENTFAYRVAQTIGDVTYTTLDPPKWTGIVTGDGTDEKTFFISGDFTDPNGGPPIASSNATGFNVSLIGPGQRTEQSTAEASDGPSSFCVKFDNLDAIGIYTLNVCAAGNMGATDGNEAYFNSSYDQTGLFVLFEENLEFGRSWAEEIIIS